MTLRGVLAARLPFQACMTSEARLASFRSICTRQNPARRCLLACGFRFGGVAQGLASFSFDSPALIGASFAIFSACGFQQSPLF